MSKRLKQIRKYIEGIMSIENSLLNKTLKSDQTNRVLTRILNGIKKLFLMLNYTDRGPIF